MNSSYDEKVRIMKKYKYSISTLRINCYVGGNIPIKKIDNAIKNFAYNLDKKTIIGLYDTTFFGNCKNGVVFTDDKFYVKGFLEKTQKIWYEDIAKMSIYETHKKDSDRKLEICLFDGTTIIINDLFLNKTVLMEFLNEMKNFDIEKEKKKNQINYDKMFNKEAKHGGLGFGRFKTVNNQYDEEKFHASQGHGFAAERANNLYDNLKGYDAKIVGDNNTKNGADRIVDDIYIQSKYCETGYRCVNECFENGGKGQFRYMHDGKPMQVEVPLDKYNEAIKAMEEKIRRGQVEGVIDPDDAKKIIRKGNFTYKQVRNIAKAGTVESIMYDAVNGAIIAKETFGVTAMVTLAISVWNGEDLETSLKMATYSGIKVGGTAFIVSILSGQLAKAGLNSALVGSSEYLVSMMGPKVSAVLCNAFRSGTNQIYGAAAMKSAAKVLRNNVITAGITFFVLSASDLADIFKGRISSKQFIKNISNTAAGIGGGTLGWVAGAAIGSSVLPGIGTVVGGVTGAMAGGGSAEKITEKMLGEIKNDADEMISIFQNVFSEKAEEYLLCQKEAEKSADRLREKLDLSMLKDMFASDDKEEFAEKILVPIIENEVSKRAVIHVPTSEQMEFGIKSVLEEIYDEMKENGEIE